VEKWRAEGLFLLIFIFIFIIEAALRAPDGQDR
jgi:hypothetical protein